MSKTRKGTSISEATEIIARHLDEIDEVEKAMTKVGIATGARTLRASTANIRRNLNIIVCSSQEAEVEQAVKNIAEWIELNYSTEREQVARELIKQLRNYFGV